MSDRFTILLAISTAAGAVAAWDLPVIAGLLLAAAALAWRNPWLLCLGALLLASAMSDRAWSGVDAAPTGPYHGVATLVSDPVVERGAVEVDVEIVGHRYRATARGAAGDALIVRLAGERVEVRAARTPRPAWARWLAIRHIGGQATLSAVSPGEPADPASRVANGLRRTLMAGASSLSPTARGLFAGMVLGDERHQLPEVADDFSAAGLTHLLAVSGQNVAFVLAMVHPATRRMGLRIRFGATVSVIAFFALLTRFEPSVLRAAVMASIAALATMLGREASGLRVLALTMSGLLILDPFLVWSVGFQLSVAASAGILLLAPVLRDRLPGPRWLRELTSVTIAAQLAVAPISVPLFGPMPLAAVPANVLAVSVAGPVTVWGFAGGLLAGAAASLGLADVARILHLPTALGLHYLAAVARSTATLPLPRIGLSNLAAVLLCGGVAGVARRIGRAQLERLAHAGVVVALLGPVALAAVAGPPPVPVAASMGRGAVLWRAEARGVASGAQPGASATASVLVIDGRVDVDDLLEALRRARVRRIDVVVAEVSSSAAADAAATLRRRFGVREVFAPARPELAGATTPPRGLVVRVGQLTLDFGRSGGPISARLEVRVRRAVAAVTSGAGSPPTVDGSGQRPGRWAWSSRRALRSPGSLAATV